MPPRWLRRALAPVWLAIEVVLLVVFALGAALGTLAVPFTRRRRLLRVSAFACGYLVMELVALPLAAWVWLRHRHSPDWHDMHRRFLAKALGMVLGWAGRCFGFRVELDGPPAPLTSDQPIVALARHGGPGDSFALVEMLLAHDRNVRIVLKDILQFDPALDVLLNRLGCCFLPSHRSAGDDLAGRLAGLASELSGRDTLLVFPEGGNFTPWRRRRAIRRLQSEHRRGAARAAALMTNVLPPRPAGILAVLEAHPDLPVVLLAHAGLDRLVNMKAAWGALPLTVPMTVRVWPSVPPPDGEEARLAWLTTEWAVVDEWVDGWHATHPEAPGHTAALG